MSRAANIVIDTFADEAEAKKKMHAQARVLRKRRITHRYGVYVEQRCGVWWLILHDRGNG